MTDLLARAREVFVLLAAVAACTCGSPGSAVPDAGHGGEPTPAYPAFEAPHPPLPQVITLGGPMLQAPKLTSLLFQSDPNAQAIARFVSQLAGSTYWTEATAEYGIGPLAASNTFELDEPPAASVTDADVQAWLEAKIEHVQDFPQPGAGTLYAVFYPATTTVTAKAGVLCRDVDGYHGDFALSSGEVVAYAVIPSCGDDPIDAETAHASHEIIEAVTDPRPDGRAALAQFDPDDVAWQFEAGGELGDVCASTGNAWIHSPGIDASVERVWSNVAAAAGHDPCEPGGASPYFNSAPVLNDAVTVVDAAGNAFLTRGLHIPVGESRTIELDLFSDAPMPGPWYVDALEDSLTTGPLPGSWPELSFLFGDECAGSGTAYDGKIYSCQGKNGDKIHLTIKAESEAPNKTAIFRIRNSATQPAGSDAGLSVTTAIETDWFVVVAN